MSVRCLLFQVRSRFLVETVLKLPVRPIFWQLGKTVVLRETGFVNEKVRVSALLIRNKPGFWQSSVFCHGSCFNQNKAVQ